jgi:hypothetical protein
MKVYIVVREGEDFHDILGIYLNNDTAIKYADTLEDDCWGDIYIDIHNVIE